MRFEGKGPSASSDSPTLPVDAIHDENNSTIGSDLGKGGVAGSSIPELGWLFSVDAFSGVFGALTAVGHLAGFAFYALKLFVAQRLFRSQFRSDRRLFKPAAKGSASLLVWMGGVGVAGFFMAAKERFVGSVLTTLYSEDFRCQVRPNVETNLNLCFVSCRLRHCLLLVVYETRRVSFVTCTSKKHLLPLHIARVRSQAGRTHLAQYKKYNIDSSTRCTLSAMR